MPAPLSDHDLDALVAQVVAETGAGPAAMGPVMKALLPLVAGRADGGRVSTAVRRRLAG